MNKRAFHAGFVQRWVALQKAAEDPRDQHNPLAWLGKHRQDVQWGTRGSSALSTVATALPYAAKAAPYVGLGGRAGQLGQLAEDLAPATRAGKLIGKVTTPIGWATTAYDVAAEAGPAAHGIGHAMGGTGYNPEAAWQRQDISRMARERDALGLGAKALNPAAWSQPVGDSWGSGAAEIVHRLRNVGTLPERMQKRPRGQLNADQIRQYDTAMNAERARLAAEGAQRADDSRQRRQEIIQGIEASIPAPGGRPLGRDPRTGLIRLPEAGQAPPPSPPAMFNPPPPEPPPPPHWSDPPPPQY